MNLDEATLEWLNDLTAQGILTTDTELRICSWNRWLEVNSGRESSEMLGRCLLDVYPELVARRLDTYYKAALQGQASVLSQRLHHYLFPMPAGTGDETFKNMQQSVRIGPLLKNDRILGTITIIDDVTERVVREAELQEQLRVNASLLEKERKARSEAEAANRAKDQFLATVSHELRTPLTAMLGWTRLLRSGKLDDKSVDRALETIERNAKAQAQLVEDILDVSRIITGKLVLDIRYIELIPIIEAAIESVRPAAEAKGIKISTMLDSRIGPIQGDPNRLQQIIWNLLSNAIKFTPEEGSVDLLLQLVDNHARISVRDTGKGISADFLPYVFDRFRQADSSAARMHGGLGLGLSIVRHLVELHGGTVAADSKGEDKGSTFTLTLPLAIARRAEPPFQGKQDQSSVSKSGMAMGEPIPRLDGLRILIVDDEQDTLEMLETMLKQTGASVSTSRNAQEALENLIRLRPDVLISDIGMPGEDGYSLIRKVRSLSQEEGGRIPAVALTAYARFEDRMRALSSGYQMHVSKPPEPAELAVVIASLAGRIGS